MELTLEKRNEIETKAKHMMEQLKAVLLLAGIEVKSVHQLPNGYCGDLCCPQRPWMLAETKYGLIKIGWRKRVISIEWPKELNIHGNDTLPKDEQKSDTSCGTTSWENGVHAWGWGNAVNQMTNLVEIAERNIYNKEADARLNPTELKEYEELQARYTADPMKMGQSDYNRLQDLSSKRHGN
jgi:hypothetical protein